MSLSGCVPAPWRAWTYEHKYEFDYPSPWNMPDREKFESFYVDGVFVNIRVMAHDETTTSGSPPYMMIIPVLTNNKEHKSVTFHSVVISSSLGRKYEVIPIVVSKAANKVKELSFPVHKSLDPFSDTVVNPTLIAKQYLTTSLWCDENLDLKPKKHEVIKISIDIEIHKSNSSERKTIEYEFYPNKESGFFQWISV